MRILGRAGHSADWVAGAEWEARNNQQASTGRTRQGAPLGLSRGRRRLSQGVAQWH